MVPGSGSPGHLHYTFLVTDSRSTTDPATEPQPNSTQGSVWNKISEGREIGELWSQVRADARETYGFYGRDIDWEHVNRLSKWHRPFFIAKEMFVAMLMKLSPARRVLLIVALVLLFLSGFQFHYGDKVSVDIRFDFLAALIFLLLLALELADKVTMKRDLEIAREIQTWLLPAEPPKIQGAEVAFATRPQNSVAGDYYDAFYPSPNGDAPGKLSLVIADVAGKSVPAALLMATFQASVHTIVREGTSIEDAILRLNRYACAHSLEGRRFTTAVLGEFDPATRSFTYVNAGHNAPVLRRRDGTIEQLESGGVPLGIVPDAQYETGSVELGSGDVLIFFTDGVVDATNESGEQFGDTRWREAVRNLPEANAEEDLRFLMRRVDAFVQQTRQFDDITYLILRCA
jgi:serine phosphatase RsbU (regulator of sigma subunit)